MENRRIIQVEEKVPPKLLIPLSIQHMFAMFGASVLVPFLFGINPAVVLFMNGVGTLLFILITKGKAPAYLGSIELVFIRAPYITSVKDGVKILCELDGHIVAAEEKNMLVTSFHPELTDNTAFLKYFVSKI